jgi:hypothetical protein
MALITTVADATSDSYVTLLEVKENLFGTALTTWNDIGSNTEREAYVRKATSIIEMQIYRGELYDADTPQALSFPRSDNYTLDTDEVTQLPFIPPRVKQAIYAQISAMLLGEGFIKQALEYRAMGITSLSMGTGSSVSFKNTAPASKDLLCAEARILLSPYFAHTTIRLERA